jgi:DNA-binding NarL/FixJ family response regulator
LADAIRVLIVHGYSLASELISREIDRQAGFRCVARCATIAAATEQIRCHDVDVVLISSTLRDGSALSAIELIHSVSPHLRSILMMTEPERSTVITAFRKGVRGVFHSPRSDFDALLKCIRCVHAGQIWASTAELELLMSALQQPEPNEPHHTVLTSRERDVVRLLVAGMTNRDIARELRLSEHTIKNYMFRIFDKVGVSSRVELLLYAMHHVQPDTARSTGSERSGGGESAYAHAS